ncbi:MAG: helix-hairpin-helix domain-containing protein [Firmicutes bacterium]|jgi:competence ComEA-like helix-hairpin-helix protein|nr:helix-hairpin-helix domain-containing protein [Bacillota bacterium]NLL88341.1 helix-hairpin-helix domain-containing protein [Bacillota bacterium]
MNARQRVVTLTLLSLVLAGNCLNLFTARQNAIRIAAAASEAADSEANTGLEPDAGEITVTKACNPDGTEHDLEQCERLHINWASEKELQQRLPGIGPVLAKRIIEKRKERFFIEAKDLLAVPGIGQKRLAQIEPLICFALPDAAD